MITAKIINKLKVKTLIVVPWLELMNQMRDDLFDIFWVKYPILNSKNSITKREDISDDIVKETINKFKSIWKNCTKKNKRQDKI